MEMWGHKLYGVYRLKHGYVSPCEERVAGGEDGVVGQGVRS